MCSFSLPNLPDSTSPIYHAEAEEDQSIVDCFCCCLQFAVQLKDLFVTGDAADRELQELMGGSDDEGMDIGSR